MESLTAQELLSWWEAGLAQPPSQRAMILLSAATGEAVSVAGRTITVGERDAQLLGLRERLFGPDLAAQARCRQCGEDLDFTLNTCALRRDRPAVDRDYKTAILDGLLIEFRVPTIDDLLAISEFDDAGAAARTLLARCVRNVARQGVALSVADLTQHAIDLLGESMRQADPLAEIQVSLACPSCGKTSPAIFDIASFLWHELDVGARRIIDEVHALARAYGWSETAILGMPGARRQLYLERIAS
jgi:hypothetical protein